MTGMQCDTTCGKGTVLNTQLNKCMPIEVKCGSGTRFDSERKECVVEPVLPKCVYNGNHKFDIQCTIDGQTFTVIQNVDMIDKSNRQKSKKHCQSVVERGDQPGGFGTCGQLMRNIVNASSLDAGECQTFHDKQWPPSLAFNMPVKHNPTQVTQTAQSCAKLCMATSDCRAFAYDPVKTQCTMHTQMPYYPPLKDGALTIGSCPKF